MLPGQHLEEITHFFDQFNAWKISWKYRDILHHIEISWNIVCIVKKQYCSWVIVMYCLTCSIYRVFFLTGSAQKVLSIRLHSKSHQKSSKCQNLLTDWHLELFGRDQLKETPCRLHLLALVASIRLILCHPRLQARLLPRVAKLPRRWPRRTKRRGIARGRSPLPSTFTRLYRLDTSKTLRILMYIRFQVLKQVHPDTWVSSMAISIMNSLR